MAFPPWDEKLGLLRHSWTGQTINNALRLAVEVPSFARAAESFTALTGVGISKSSLQRLVMDYGACQVSREEEEARAMSAVPSKEEEVVWREQVKPDSETMSVSVDGVMIHVREEGWKEVKLVSVSAVEQEVDEETGDTQAKLKQHSYRGGLWDAKHFTNHHWAEACRRGLENAKQVVCVSDGAVWIWMIAFICFPLRVEILDWWHAIQYLWSIAHECFGDDATAANVWVAEQKQLLRSQGLSRVLHSIRQLYPRYDGIPPTVRQAVGYFFRNRRRMQYDQYRRDGLPIASGTVESACKTVVQARLKQAGMRWSRDGAQAMISLRCLLLSNRWHELPIPQT